jgi:cytochrome c
MIKTIRATLTAILAGSLMLILAPAAHAFDETAAKALFKDNDCGKCHAVAKEKKGPSLKKIAKENAGKPNVMAEMIKHITSGQKVKLEDGTEEDHKIIDTKDKAAQQNLIEWILAQ